MDIDDFLKYAEGILIGLVMVLVLSGAIFIVLLDAKFIFELLVNLSSMEFWKGSYWTTVILLSLVFGCLYGKKVIK